MSRKFLVIILSALLPLISYSQHQPIEPTPYFNDIGFQRGFILSAKRIGSSYLSGEGFNINFGQSFGKSDISRVILGYYSDIDNVENHSFASFTYGYRSQVSRTRNISTTITSFGDFIFQLIQSAFPRNFELSVGPTIGYIASNQTSPYLNTDEFRVRRNFLLSLDAILGLHYNVWRFRLTGNITTAYSLTKNFEYHSFEISSNGSIPRWFIKPSIGVSFAF